MRVRKRDGTLSAVDVNKIVKRRYGLLDRSQRGGPHARGRQSHQRSI